MMICFFIAATILVVTSCIVYKNRKYFNLAVRIMLVGIVGIVTSLIFPMYRESYDTFTSILFSALYALRSLSGCQSVDLSHKIAIDGWLHYGYYALLYFSFIAAPLFTTSFLISVFGNFNDKIRYRFLLGKEVHIFSSLNESTITMCESIGGKHKRFIFCNTKLSASDKDSNLVRRARKIGAIILDCSELDLKIHKKSVRFYQASDSKDYNINTTIALVEKYRNTTNTDIRIATLSSGITAELLLDSMEKGNVRVKLIDDVKYTCYSLLDSAPLFVGAVDNKISALIVGCDYTGTEMLKAMIWCGQITGYSLEINVIDINAEMREKQFLKNCPDISLEKYGIRFIKADICTSEFENALNQYCKDATYVVVMTGNDKLNIDTAVYLRKYYLRNDPLHFHNKPRINLRVRDSLKNKQMDALSDANIESYALYAFGSIEKTFNVNNLMSSPLEKMAIGVHLAYYNALNGTDEQIYNAMEGYYLKEYNQRSSFASALHIRYKMFACGVKGLNNSAINDEQINEFEKMIQSPTTLEFVAKLEHERWIAFMRTEGYSLASPDEVSVYRALEKKPSHIHYLAKLHPTLIPWDELDKMSKTISEIMNRDYDFKQSDFDIVKRIPDIIRAKDSKITYWTNK